MQEHKLKKVHDVTYKCWAASFIIGYTVTEHSHLFFFHATSEQTRESARATLKIMRRKKNQKTVDTYFEHRKKKKHNIHIIVHPFIAIIIVPFTKNNFFITTNSECLNPTKMGGNFTTQFKHQEKQSWINIS